MNFPCRTIEGYCIVSMKSMQVISRDNFVVPLIKRRSSFLTVIVITMRGNYV